MKILPVEAEFSMRTNGQTDKRNLPVRFDKFCESY